METLSYLVSGIIAVAWSVWIFVIWQKRADLAESSPLRFILLFLPASFFLLISISGWSSVMFLRIDIIGLIIFIILVLLTWFIQFLTLPLENRWYRPVFIISLIVCIACSIGLVCFIYVLKLYPMTAISLSAFFRSLQHIDFLRFLWYVLNPETNKQDIYSIINKLVIAACAYLPLTIVRIWYTNKKFKQLKREIDLLKLEMERQKTIETAATSGL
ncbi:MAG: hypothetical protein JW881_17495 [Spirochaetales bacterium]|nr:hypothetical protein [Spirochaetales bacterium]